MSAPHLFMTADSVGGVWRYALDLASSLAEAGVRTTLAVVGPGPDDAQAAEARAIPGLELIVTGLPLDWTAADRPEVEGAGVVLAAMALRARPDLIQFNSPAYAAFARFPMPTLAVAHSCVATWWAAVKGDEPLPQDFAWRTELTALGYRACDAVAAPSFAFAQATARTYGLAGVPRVVRNGRRAPAPARPAPAAPSGPFAFTAGRLWDEGKNVVLFDAAVAHLSLPGFAAGPLRAPHGEERRFSALQTLGMLAEPDLAGWLAARPIFVSPALYEPFGLAVLEAAQAGCPLVLSDIATFRELWDGAAVFVDPRDPAGLAEVLDRLASDPDQRRGLGEAARRRSAAYNLEAQTAAMLELYRTLAPGPFGVRGAAA